MRRKIRSNGVSQTIWLALWVFLINYVWESLQCVPFFVHGRDEGPFLLVMARASAGDVLLTALIVLLVGALRRDLLWWRGTVSRRQWAQVWLIAVPLAVAVERWALATGRWSYTDTNPLIPVLDVSLLPVIQLPICLWIAHGCTTRVYPRNVHP